MKKTIAILVAALVAMLFFLLSSFQFEPTYMGAPYSHWIRHHNPERHNPFRQALATWGTNAVPFLIVSLQQRESLFNRTLRANRIMLPGFISSRLPLPPSPGLERRRAAEGLKQLGPLAAAALPALVETLSDPDPSLRSACLAALEAIGPAAEPSLPEIAKCLADPDSQIRALAGRTLRAVERKDPDQRSNRLVDLLGHPAPAMRLGTAECLLALDPGHAPAALHTLDRLLNSPERNVRHDAALTLLQTKAPHEIKLSACRVLLRQRNHGLHLPAFEELEKIGPDAAPLLPDLLPLLNSPNHMTRSGAARTAGFISSSEEGTARMLIPLLEDPDHRTRLNALHALHLLSYRGADIIAPLVRIVAEQHPILHMMALSILQESGPQASPALPILVKLAGSSTNETRALAIRVLGSIGPHARDAIPELLKLLELSDPPVQILSAEALALIDPAHLDQSRTVLTNALFKARQRRHASTAASALARLGQADDAVQNELRILSENEDSFSKHDAAAARLRVNADDSGAGAILQTSLREGPVSDAMLAARLLGELGPTARPAMPALAHAASHGDANLRAAARKAMNRIAPSYREAAQSAP